MIDNQEKVWKHLGRIVLSAWLALGLMDAYAATKPELDHMRTEQNSPVVRHESHKAEDVCQDVFVRLITNAPDLQEGREKAWLLKVALNRCRDLWRGAWLKRVVLGSPAFELVPAPDEFGKLAEQQEIMQAINQLPSTFKEVILLHYYQGFGIAEIAEMMELPEGTISSRLSRGRKKLEIILKGGDAR